MAFASTQKCSDQTEQTITCALSRSLICAGRVYSFSWFYFKSQSAVKRRWPIHISFKNSRTHKARALPVGRPPTQIIKAPTSPLIRWWCREKKLCSGDTRGLQPKLRLPFPLGCAIVIYLCGVVGSFVSWRAVFVNILRSARVCKFRSATQKL
jgi:hypothetical protein